MPTPPDSPVTFLVVEDDMLIAAKLSMLLTKLGYEVTGIVPRGEEAIRHARENPPAIVLLDINLKGSLDGIETAHALHEMADIPIIYVTANTDEATFNRAKATRPYAFIGKPIKNIDLQRAIELTVSRMVADQQQTAEPDGIDSEPFVLNDRIFVRHKDRMVKLVIDDILYIEADRNYCCINMSTGEYVLTTTLKTMEEKLPTAYFLRIHRSFLINLRQVEEVAENHVVINRKSIPLSHLLRLDLLRRIKMV